MHVAVRPYLATGVALLGAASIAVAPVQPSNPLLSVPALPAVSSAAFTLTAQANPIALWASVFNDAIANVGVLGENVLADPAPALRQLLKNQFGYLGTAVGAGKSMVDGAVQYLSPSNPYSLPAGINTAVGQLRSGQISEAFITLSQALIATPIMMIIGLPLAGSGLLEVPVKMAQNFADVVAAVLSLNTALPLLSSALGPVVGAFDALGSSLQDVVGALGSGRIVDALTAVINIPAQLTGAVLNGYTDVEGVVHPGLLSFDVDGVNGGLIQTLLVTIPRAIATALGVAPAASKVPADAARAVSAPLAAAASVVTLAVPGAESGTAAGEVDQAANGSGASAAGPVVAGPSEESPAEDAATDTAGDVSVAEPAVDESQPPADGVTEPKGGDSSAGEPKTDEAGNAGPGDSDADGPKVSGPRRSGKGSESKSGGGAGAVDSKDSDAKDSDAKDAKGSASSSDRSSTAKRVSARSSSSADA